MVEKEGVIEAEVIGFSKELVNVEELDEKSGEKVVRAVPVAVITLRCDVPDFLPVGKIVTLGLAKMDEKA